MAFIYMNITHALKEEWNNAICSNMDGPRDYHTRWSKSEKDKYFHHLYVEYKKWYKWAYLQNRNRLTDTENKIMVTKRKGWEEIN